MADGATLAQEVLRLRDKPYELLSLTPGLPPVTPQTLVSDARRNYMRLAAFIHPDKLKHYDRATEAFQALVRAFEAVANPPKLPLKRAAKAATATAKPAPKQAKPKPERKTVMTAPKKKKKPVKKRRADEDDFIESDSDYSESESEDEDASYSEGEYEKETAAELAAHASDPSAPENNPARNNYCFRTRIDCPNCTTPWTPDTNPLYTLFMAHHAKTHCETCLLQYGCFTGIHYCPHCKKIVDYDPAKYHQQVNCAYCHRSYGYMFYKVTPQVLHHYKQKEAAAAETERKTREREERAAKRRGGGDREGGDGEAYDDKILDLVGKCMIEEACPLCRKQVKSKHRAHIAECMANPERHKKAPQVRKFIIDDDGSKKKHKKRKTEGKPSTKRGLTAKK